MKYANGRERASVPAWLARHDTTRHRQLCLPLALCQSSLVSLASKTQEQETCHWIAIIGSLIVHGGVVVDVRVACCRRIGLVTSESIRNQVDGQMLRSATVRMDRHSLPASVAVLRDQSLPKVVWRRRSHGDTATTMSLSNHLDSHTCRTSRSESLFKIISFPW